MHVGLEYNSVHRGHMESKRRTDGESDPAEMATLNSSYFSANGDLTSRTLPLINRTAVFLYTFQDLLKPGPQDVLQSTLPFYHIAIFTACLVLWIVLLVYFWKFVYYEVNDPYATPFGSAPPWEKRMISDWNSNKILDYINYFTEKVTPLGGNHNY